MIRVAGCDKVGRPLLPCLAMLSHARQLTPIHTDDEEKERERERERERVRQHHETSYRLLQGDTQFYTRPLSGLFQASFRLLLGLFQASFSSRTGAFEAKE